MSGTEREVHQPVLEQEMADEHQDVGLIHGDLRDAILYPEASHPDSVNETVADSFLREETGSAFGVIRVPRLYPSINIV